MGVYNLLRTVATTAAAVVEGGWNVATSSDRGPMAVLSPGDVAPAFALEGSDGRVHRLDEAVGREAVVLAWFPKAFTGG